MSDLEKAKATNMPAASTPSRWGARMYSPMLGRFLAADPIEGGNTSTYSYPNNPVNMLDLDGNRQDCGSCYHGKVTGTKIGNWGPVLQTDSRSGSGKGAVLARSRSFPKNHIDLQVTARAIRNLVPTTIALGAATTQGGTCSAPDSKAFIVCTVPLGHGYFSGGTTYGNAFVSARSGSRVPADLRGHEDAHARQWAAGGADGFVTAYLVSALIAGGNGCGIYFEQAAGLAEGDYVCK